MWIHKSEPLEGQLELFKKWRLGASVALPIAMLAYVVAIYYELVQRPVSMFDVVGYVIQLAGLFVITLLMWWRLDLLRFLISLIVVGVLGWYAAKLIYALYFDSADILGNLTGNFVWTPVVLVVAYFAPGYRFMFYFLVSFVASIMVVTGTYIMPRLGTEDPATLQVLMQIALSLGFTSCVVFALEMTNRHFQVVRDSAQRFEELAFKDELTGLANQLIVNEHIEALSARSHFALALINIDQFGEVNKQYSKAFGDAILCQVASRLRSHFAEDALLARLWGNEFIVASEQPEYSREPNRLGVQVLKVFDNPFYVSETEVILSASIGLVTYPKDATDPVTLLHKAHAAMRRVKDYGKNGFAIGSFTHFGRDSLHNELTVSLAKGFSWESFKLCYSPIVDLSTEKVVGSEAVMLWRSSTGWLDVADLANALDASGAVVAVQRAALEHGTYAAPRSGLPTISFDISPLHFAQADTATFIRRILSESGLSPSAMTLDITSATLKTNLNLVRDTLEVLTDMGVSVCLDRYGQDFISEEILTSLPLTGIKLAPALLSANMFGRDQMALTRTLLASLTEQAHGAGLSVTATGIETAFHLDILKGIACDFGQGSYWGEPKSVLIGAGDRKLS